MWLQPHFLTTAETLPDRAAAAQRKSRRMWSRLRLMARAALPLLPLPCRHGAGGGLVRSTAIKYTKKPPRADGRRRRLFMADFSGSGTGSGAMIGSGCSGSWSGTRLGASGTGTPRPGYLSQHPKGQKGASQKKTKPLCRKVAKRSRWSRTGLGCNGWKRGKSGTQCSGRS